jgi:glycine/D-amino acid oxidase-like deaminating enzyme
VPVGDISLWMTQAGEVGYRDALLGESRADVVIVGGGYTGLWTAYYLKSHDPSLEVCLLEARYCGFGASGRNGGWMMSALQGETSLLGTLDGERRREVQDCIHGILPEVASVLTRHGIDCDFHQGGGLYAAARYPQQLQLQRELLAGMRAAGLGEEHARWLDADALAARLNIRAPFGAIFTPHIARIHPARLVRGLASLVDSLGVRIYERSAATGIAGGAVLTMAGRIVAPRILLALEGYSPVLAPLRGRMLALQSRIVATEPMDEARWAEIGLHDNEVFCDASPLVTYGQRSADGRLVFGARGSYRFGGGPRSEFPDDDPTFRPVERLMRDCFPQLADVPVTHRWGGNARCIPKWTAPRGIRSGQRPGYGGWLPGRGCRRIQPDGAHPVGSGARARYAAGAHALGAAGRTAARTAPLGTGTPALAGV